MLNILNMLVEIYLLLILTVNANFENICIYLESLNIVFDIIAISETWAQSDQTSQFHLPGYSSFHIVRGY